MPDALDKTAVGRKVFTNIFADNIRIKSRRFFNIARIFGLVKKIVVMAELNGVRRVAEIPRELFFVSGMIFAFKEKISLRRASERNGGDRRKMKIGFVAKTLHSPVRQIIISGYEVEIVSIALLRRERSVILFKRRFRLKIGNVS